MDRRTILTGIAGLSGAAFLAAWQDKRPGTKGALQDNGVARALPPSRAALSGSVKSVTIGQLPIGAGGFVTGIDISADNSRFVCRSDVNNAFIRDEGDMAWRPLFSPATLALQDYDPLPEMKDKADGNGVAGLRMAPSNKDIIYCSFRGYIWRTVDGGRTMQRTRFPQKAMFANTGEQRLYNRTIDVHPRDPNRVIVGTTGEGVWFTLDGGLRWSEANLPPAGKSHEDHAGSNLTLYHSAEADTVFVFVTGVGLFRSDQGPGGNFRFLAGGPLFCSSLVSAQDGNVYLCERTKAHQGGKFWRLSPEGQWNSTDPGREAFVAAVDPHDPARIVVSNGDGWLLVSLDRGSSFADAGVATFSQTGNEIGWMRGLSNVFPAQLEFDRRLRGRLWMAQGVGVVRADPLEGRYQLRDWSAGIELLCTVSALSVPGGKTFLSAWDKSFWRVDDETAYTNDFRYPVVAGKAHTADFVSHASYMDFAGDDPTFLVGIVAPGPRGEPGFTRDGGERWEAFSGRPPEGWNVGGCIAASTKKNFVLLPSNNGGGNYTLDGGQTWLPVKLDGKTQTTRFSNAYYVNRKNLAADKTRPGTFALVYTVGSPQDRLDEPLGGFWLTRDGGQTWTQQLKGIINSGSRDPAEVRLLGQEFRQFWQCQLEYVPGQPGELVYTPHADGSNDRFFHSLDDGATWKELGSRVRNVRCFALGKARNAGQRPTIFFWGDVEGRKGLYVSLDWFASKPQLLSRFPSPMLAEVNCLAADPDRFGRAYVGTNCAGWLRVALDV